MARRTSTNKPSGAALRAMRDARAAVDPKAEAQARETSLLKSLTTAREDFDWFVSTQAWTHLGFETFTGWWMARVQPVSDALMRPVREVARAAIDLMTEEQKALPPAQRLRQRDIAAAVGASQATISRRSRDADASDVDLEESTQEPVDAPDGPNPVASTMEESITPPIDSSTPNSPVAADSVEAEKDVESVPRALVADQSPSDQQPGSNSLTGQPHASDMPEGEPPTATGQSGTDHPSATGEAPADVRRSSASGAGEMPPDVGEASGDETAGGLQAPGPSAVDPEEPFTEWGDDLIDVIGRRPAAVEALGAPALYLEALWREVDELTQWCDEVDRIRKGAAS